MSILHEAWPHRKPPCQIARAIPDVQPNGQIADGRLFRLATDVMELKRCAKTRTGFLSV